MSSDNTGRFEVKGFPTLKFFPANSIVPEDYSGGRTADAILAWINDKLHLSAQLKKVGSYTHAI